MRANRFYALAILFYALSGCGEHTSESTLHRVSSLQEMMARPLMTGAGVTSSSTVPSPGMVLAQKYSTSQSAIVVARSGAKGVDVIPLITDSTLNGRSIVIGVDLMFWDSTLGNIGPSIAALENLINRSAARKIPVVIGDIPSLLGFLQGQRSTLNQKIRELCVAEKGCRILPLDAINQELTNKGFIEFNNRRYTRSDLLPDGLHLSRIGSEIIATQLERVIASSVTAR